VKATMRRALVIALAGAAVVSAAPAAGDSGRRSGAPSASAGVQHEGNLVIRRDGSIAVPFRAHPGTEQGKEPIFRRDGSRAVRFVPSTGSSVAGAETDRFDWGDAAIGAAGAFGLVLVGFGTLALVRRSRQADVRPSAPAAVNRG
jgi:hypothetical protein